MTISYLTFIKHAEKMVKDIGFAKPALKGVYHTFDGSVIVSDGRRVYKALDVQSRNDGASIDPGTGKEIEGAYPSIQELIPKGLVDRLHVQSATYLHLVTDAFIKAGVVPKPGEKKGKKEDVILRLEAVHNNAATDLSVESKALQASIDLGQSENYLYFEYRINAEHFLQALALFKDAGHEELYLNFYEDEFAFQMVSTDTNASLRAVIPVVFD
ncbi:hypothetical protein P8884_00360 [Bacillus haynesii]|nr:hypothetical protein [Bacillus haynesii]